MLDKYCKIVLDTLIENGFTYPKTCFESVSKSLIPILPKTKGIEWSLETLTPLLQYLRLNGYVDYIEFSHGYYPVLDCYMLYTTHKGTYYKKFNMIKFQEFLYKSIFTPIAISVITTIIAFILA